VIPQVRDSDARSPSSLLAAGPAITPAGQVVRQRRIDAIPDQGDVDRTGTSSTRAAPGRMQELHRGCAGPYSRAGGGSYLR